MSDRRETNVARWLVATQVASRAVGRRYCCFRAEAAEHDSRNENSARRPAQRIGSQRGRWASGPNGSRMLGDVQCLPVSLHRDVPSSVT